MEEKRCKKRYTCRNPFLEKKVSVCVPLFIQPDGSFAEKKLLVAAGSDGMTMDSLKNVYLTNQDNSSVDIYSPSGQLLEFIHIPETPANVTLGGLDKKTLFITAKTSLYSLAMCVAGQ